MLLAQGPVWDVLSSIIQREILVLGTHGRGGLKKLALGSVAGEVLRLAKCPVLTIGPDDIGPAAYYLGAWISVKVPGYVRRPSSATVVSQGGTALVTAYTVNCEPDHIPKTRGRRK
jgi:Universal stress protein family